METRNNYLQMASQEFDINHGGNKMNLLKTFNSKRIGKFCYHFQVSIFTLFIFKILANSSFASFPARTIRRTIEYREIYSREIYSPKRTIFVYQVLKENSLLNIIYCNLKLLCVTYEGDSDTQEKYWVDLTNICKDNQIEETKEITFLQDCLPFRESSPQNTDNIGEVLKYHQDRQDDIKRYYCKQQIEKLRTDNQVMLNIGFGYSSDAPTIEDQIGNLYPECTRYSGS